MYIIAFNYCMDIYRGSLMYSVRAVMMQFEINLCNGFVILVISLMLYIRRKCCVCCENGVQQK